MTEAWQYTEAKSFHNNSNAKCSLTDSSWLLCRVLACAHNTVGAAAHSACAGFNTSASVAYTCNERMHCLTIDSLMLTIVT